MLYFSNITKIYDGSLVALSEITAKIKRGDYVCLVGPGGAGKSTFIRLAFGAIGPSRGEVLLEGVNLARLSRRKLIRMRRSIGTIFQHNVLIPTATVAENVSLPLDILGIRGRKRSEALDRILSRVGLEHRRDARPSELSGGEKQRVAVARAIIHDPPLLLADEPTQNLDKHMASVVADILAEMQDRGSTVVVATHNSRLFEGSLSRAIRLSQGRIIS